MDRYYLGMARVKVQNLRYSSSSTEGDDCTGCCISDLEHNIPALITPSQFHESLADSKITKHTLYELGPAPEMHFPASIKLECLHGRFRLDIAGRMELNGLDMWWTVDLYSSEAPTNILLQVRQHYKRHLALCDGEKYLHIRYYEREQNAADAGRWRKLLDARVKSLNQILRNEWLCKALDKLEPFRSLWTSFQLGSFPLILSWRCSQEIEHYLNRMQGMWREFTGGSGTLCDENTIRKLEGLAPQWSSRDRALIENLFRTNQVFYRVDDPALRAEILQRVVAVEGYILSFRTFFKHVKVLGPVMIRLRELFPASDLVPPRAPFEPIQRRAPSIRDILLQKYYKGLDAEQCLIQYSREHECYIETHDRAIYSYWQICLSLLRDQHGPWKPLTKAKDPQEVTEYPEWLVKLGQLARRLGFESDRIVLLCRQDPDLSQIRTHMLEEKPSSDFSVSLEDFEQEARTRQNGQSIFERRPPLPLPLMTTDSNLSDSTCRTHKGLFLPTIWSALVQETRCSLTDFGTLLLILTSFFGNFGPGHASPTRDEPGPEILATRLVCPREASNYTSRCLSSYSPPNAPSPSSVYSIPAHPALSEEPIHAHHAQNITFWHLPASRQMYPTREYSCEPNLEGVRDVFQDIHAKGFAPLFTLVDGDGRLKICAPLQLLHRRKRSKTPNDIYYIYGNENRQIWLLKELENQHRV